MLVFGYDQQRHIQPALVGAILTYFRGPLLTILTVLETIQLIAGASLPVKRAMSTKAANRNRESPAFAC